MPPSLPLPFLRGLALLARAALVRYAAVLGRPYCDLGFSFVPGFEYLNNGRRSEGLDLIRRSGDAGEQLEAR